MIEVDKGVEVVVVKMSPRDYELLCDALTKGSFNKPPETDYQKEFQQAIKEFLPESLHSQVFCY